MIHFNKDDLEEEFLVCFLHIPKTGGQTLWGILKAQPTNIIVKHGTYFEKFNKPCAYVTMLRDPVDRVISTYYYIRNTVRDPLCEQVNEMSLEEFISYMEREDIENNPYEPMEDLRNIKFRTVNLATRYLSGGDPTQLAEAKENLRNYFLFAGMTEMYSESLFFMEKLFGWKIAAGTKMRNNNPNRIPVHEVSPSMIERIKELNQLDIELYEGAKAKFLRQIELLSKESKVELEAWKEKFTW